jgi:hypothetical protein
MTKERVPEDAEGRVPRMTNGGVPEDDEDGSADDERWARLRARTGRIPPG